MRLLKALGTASVAALALVAIYTPALSQDQPAVGFGRGLGAALRFHTITEGKAYWAEGGNNAGFVVGDTGVIVVDTSPNETTAKQLIAKVKEVTPLPITHVILTHSDCDHTQGIVAFPTDVKIVAHEKNAYEQRQVLRLATVEVYGGHGLPAPDRLPNVLVNQPRIDTKIDGVRVSLIYYGPAHTSGDLVIYFPDHKLAFVGDYLMKGQPDPSAQRNLWFKFEKGGSIEGWFKGQKGLMSLDATAYVPGHGASVFTKAEVKAIGESLAADKKRVDDMAEAGKSLEEIKLAMGDDKVAPMGGFGPRGPQPKAPGQLTCGRGIEYMTFAWLEYHEWLAKKETMKR